MCNQCIALIFIIVLSPMITSSSLPRREAGISLPLISCQHHMVSLAAQEAGTGILSPSGHVFPEILFVRKKLGFLSGMFWWGAFLFDELKVFLYGDIKSHLSAADQEMLEAPFSYRGPPVPRRVVLPVPEEQFIFRENCFLDAPVCWPFLPVVTADCCVSMAREGLQEEASSFAAFVCGEGVREFPIYTFHIPTPLPSGDLCQPPGSFCTFTTLSLGSGSSGEFCA